MKNKNYDPNLAPDSVLVQEIEKANLKLADIVLRTPTMLNERLSEKFAANIYMKREDLQVVRSYKIRGAYNKMSSLTDEEKKKGVICASAGNHAQGFAMACKLLEVKGKVFMPTTTPKQKINKVKFFGREFVEVILVGDNYDDSYSFALEAKEKEDLTFIHPFEDELVIAGQGSVGLEIIEEMGDRKIDYVIVPVGGGGLCSGVSQIIKSKSPSTQILAVEPMGAPSMKESLEVGHVVTLNKVDPFVDGASVRRIGELNLSLSKGHIYDINLVDEGRICSTILELYNEDAIVVEPAGALSIATLKDYADLIKGKNVVCIISGGNNDITRMEEIKERSLQYEGLKHYFIINFPQRAGALRDFLNHVLGPKDDITFFEYVKKSHRSDGPAIVGIELNNKADYDELIERMNQFDVDFENINENPLLYGMFIH